VSAPPPPPLDIVSTVTFALSLAIAPGVAAVVAPYAVIILCAMGGAAFSASSVAETTRKGTLWHLILWTGVAVVFTVPSSELLARVSGLEIRWLFAPVAGLIGARPRWLWLRIVATLDRRIGYPPEHREEGHK
jgi:hypothetical protein